MPGFWKSVNRVAIKAGKHALKEFLFQGSSVSAKKQVEAAFESAGYEIIKQAYDESTEAQQFFASISLDFPDSDAEVAAFIDDLSDTQAAQLAAFFKDE